MQTGWIAPRNGDGAFLQTAIGENGQSGFQEGNAAQYTWMVPQDLPDLVRGMGGPAAAAAKLDTFFSQLNADEDKPYAWMGNEPSLGSPWTYLAAGEPWRTQAIVRTVMTTLYNDTPEGIPGNDDLGTMSAWYVWSRDGSLSAVSCGARTRHRLPALLAHRHPRTNGPTITIDAPSASDTAPYVDALRIDGTPTQHTWIALPTRCAASRVRSRVVAESLGAPDDDAMPAFASTATDFPPSTPCASTFLRRRTLTTGRQERVRDRDVRKHWSNADDRSRGALRRKLGFPSHRRREPADLDGKRARPSTRHRTGASGLYNVRITTVDEHDAQLQPATIDVRAQQDNERLPLAWIANRFSDTVRPYDLRTGALGAPITVGDEPRDGVLTPDNRLYFVADRGAKTVSVIDTVANQVVADDRASATRPTASRSRPTARRSGSPTTTTARFSRSTCARCAPAKPLDVGTGPRYIAIAPDGSRLYVTTQGSNAVARSMRNDRTLLAPIPVGERPCGLALSPDGKRLYVVDNGENTVTIVDLATGRDVARVPVGVEPMYRFRRPDRQAGLRHELCDDHRDADRPHDEHRSARHYRWRPAVRRRVAARRLGRHRHPPSRQRTRAHRS